MSTNLHSVSPGEPDEIIATLQPTNPTFHSFDSTGTGIITPALGGVVGGSTALNANDGDTSYIEVSDAGGNAGRQYGMVTVDLPQVVVPPGYEWTGYRMVYTSRVTAGTPMQVEVGPGSSTAYPPGTDFSRGLFMDFTIAENSTGYHTETLAVAESPEIEWYPVRSSDVGNWLNPNPFLAIVPEQPTTATFNLLRITQMAFEVRFASVESVIGHAPSGSMGDDQFLAHHGDFCYEYVAQGSDTSVLVKGPTGNMPFAKRHCGAFEVPGTKQVTVQAQFVSDHSFNIDLYALWYDRSTRGALIPGDTTLIRGDIAVLGLRYADPASYGAPVSDYTNMVVDPTYFSLQPPVVSPGATATLTTAPNFVGWPDQKAKTSSPEVGGSVVRVTKTDPTDAEGAASLGGVTPSQYGGSEQRIPVTAGTDYTFIVGGWTAQAQRMILFDLNWYDSVGTQIASWGGQGGLWRQEPGGGASEVFEMATNQWTWCYTTAQTAPPGAFSVSPTAFVYHASGGSIPNGEQAYVAGWSMVEGDHGSSFNQVFCFDGNDQNFYASVSDYYAYNWNGSSPVSTSRWREYSVDRPQLPTPWTQVDVTVTGATNGSHWRPKFVFWVPDGVGGKQPLPDGTSVLVDCIYVPENGLSVQAEPYLDGDQPGGMWEGVPRISTSIWEGTFVEDPNAPVDPTVVVTPETLAH